MEKKKSFRARLAKNIQKNWILYVMMLPVVIYYIVFAYAPMYGVQLAFKNYKIKLGIMGSPWVGLDHFKRFFNSYNFSLLLKNTLGISIYSLLVGCLLYTSDAADDTDDLHESGYRRFQYDLKSFGHGAAGFPLQTEMV